MPFLAVAILGGGAIAPQTPELAPQIAPKMNEAPYIRRLSYS